MKNRAKYSLLFTLLLFSLFPGCKQKSAVKKADSASSVVKASIFHKKGIVDLAAINNRQLISAGRDSLVVLWDIQNKISLRSKRLPHQPEHVIFSSHFPDRVHIVCAKGVIYTLSLPDLKLLNTRQTLFNNISQLEYSNILQQFLGTGDGRVFALLPGSTEIKILNFPFTVKSDFALHTRQPLMIFVNRRRLQFINLQTFRPVFSLALRAFKTQKSLPTLVRFAGSKQFVVAAGNNLWFGDWEKRQVEQARHSHLAPVTALSVEPGSLLCASGSMDKSIKIWDIEQGLLRASLYGHFFNITALQFFDSLKVLASSSEDGTIVLWDLNTFEQLRRFGSIERAQRSPWKLTVKNVRLARTFKVGDRTFNVARPGDRMLKVLAEITNTSPAPAMFFSSNFFLIDSDGNHIICSGLENYVALEPQSYFKRLLLPGQSIKGRFIFVITPPYQNYQLTYETLPPVSLDAF